MGLAQRAFLSATSGGPGSCGSSIELMKKRGRSKEDKDVEKLVEDSLKRQFGRKDINIGRCCKECFFRSHFPTKSNWLHKVQQKLRVGEAYRILEAIQTNMEIKTRQKKNHKMMLWLLEIQFKNEIITSL